MHGNFSKGYGSNFLIALLEWFKGSSEIYRWSAQTATGWFSDVCDRRAQITTVQRMNNI